MINPRESKKTFYHCFNDNNNLIKSVVNAIANAENSSPIDIDPIYDSIEPKLINSLAECADVSDQSPPVRLTFFHEGYRINVDSTGKIVLDRDETGTSAFAFVRPSSGSATLEESPEEYTCQYDFGNDHSLTVILAKAIAVIKNTRPTELSPLYESIDPKVLNALSDYASQRDDPSPVSLEFVHSNHRITVNERGEISIRDRNTGSKITDVVRDIWNSDLPLTAPR